MLINIDRESPVPVYIQIKNQIRDMILSGNLPEDFVLPPERKLANTLGVNRTTVLNAYRELKAEDLIDSHIGKGTLVKKVNSNIHTGLSGTSTDPVPWRQIFNESAGRAREPLLRDLMELANREDVISFAAGIAVPELDPIEELKDVNNRLLKEYGKALMQHTPTEGHHFFRESIVRLLAARGISVQTEEIMVLSGSQQGIDFAARIFIDPGDVVIVEDPSFFSALQIFKLAGARIMSVPIDSNGIRVDLLESILERYKPKFIYTMPTFQNPSGVVMSIERRKKLLELAYRYQVPIIEDDPYGILRYSGDHVPSLKALDTHGYVLYLSTFSKIMFPGLRVGFLAASRQVIRQFTMIKQMADLHSNSMSQWIVDQFIRKGFVDKHIKTLCRENSKRMKVMLNALEKYAPEGVEWNIPDGGLYIWCRLPDEVSQSKLMLKATEYKVAFVPGDAFSLGLQSQNYIRLNFTFPSPDQIQEGIKRLMKAIEETMDETIDVYREKKIEIKPIV